MKQARFRRGFRFLLAFALGLPALSCSDNGDDTVEAACRIIVQQCHMNSTMGACIDELVSLPPECLDCLTQNGCDYVSCQRDPNCRLPQSLIKAE
jgi:hypothetical protein